MTTTTYYNLNIVEGTDIVNPLTVDNPNYEKIDEEMHNNAVAGVTLATEIANATVHAITRENSDCAVIRFIATSRWKAGDTVTVDGVPVTALLPNGETLPDGAYVINANVLCILTGTNLTVYLGGNKVENASDVIYNDTNVGSELDALNTRVEQINTRVEQINSNLTELTERIESNTCEVSDYVDITQYNSASNLYTFPSDGYATISGNNGGFGQIIILSPNGSNIVSFSNSNTSLTSSNSLFVKKGMKCYTNAISGTLNTNIWGSFRPLK